MKIIEIETKDSIYKFCGTLIGSANHTEGMYNSSGDGNLYIVDIYKTKSCNYILCLTCHKQRKPTHEASYKTTEMLVEKKNNLEEMKEQIINFCERIDWDKLYVECGGIITKNVIYID